MKPTLSMYRDVIYCIGKVVKYAASSAAGLCDQLYHIEWEDGVSE
jgi:hypothetical protein